MLWTMRLVRAVWTCLVAGVVWLAGPTSATEMGPRSAEASVSVALTLQELVDGSERAVEVVATERRSVWEQVEGSRRIVTYTTVRVLDSLFGPRGSSLQVRTLGGVVGKIGQHVSGEPQLAVGARCLLFLTPLPIDANDANDANRAYAVAGRAQGHYPIVKDDDGARRLRASPDRGRVLPRRGPSISAHEQLVGRRVAAAYEAVRKARHRRDEKR